VAPSGSGTNFHFDPNGTSAWNWVIRGRKRWLLYPPGDAPPGVRFDGTTGILRAPPTAEWLEEVHESLEERARPVFDFVQSPGEVVFVPRGWWHAVLNLDDTVAITHNFVTVSGAAHASRMLRENQSVLSRPFEAIIQRQR